MEDDVEVVEGAAELKVARWSVTDGVGGIVTAEPPDSIAGVSCVNHSQANTQKAYEQRMSLLTTTLSYDDLTGTDMVIEAVFEEMGVKEAVFKQLDKVMKPGEIGRASCRERVSSPV